MAKNTSLSLGEHFEGLIATLVAEGRYSNASDVMRGALRLLEEHERKLTALRQALDEGAESGPYEPYDPPAIMREARQEAGLDA